jgi:hypothetical protein
MPGRIVWLIAAYAAALVWLWPSTAAARGLLSPEEQNQVARMLDRKPMVFFRAKGPADSCGPGCSEWIAATGQIVPGTAERFRAFLNALGPVRLPVFFHSPGGNLGEGIKIGEILRDGRMTAGVGRTTTSRCRIFSAQDTKCQAAIKAAAEIKAVSLTAGQCHSACIYSFAGGSVRGVMQGAQLGIHAGKIDKKLAAAHKITAADIVQARYDLQKYLIRMGIDPQVEELSEQVSHQRIYVLGRVEIDRFGMTTRGQYETRWILHRDTPQKRVVLKAVSQPAAAGASPHLTSMIQISCDAWSGLAVHYRRELPLNNVRPQSTLSATIGASNLVLRKEFREQEAVEIGFAAAGRDAVDAISAQEILVTETTMPTETVPARSRSLKLSTAGLGPAIKELMSSCPPLHTLR